VSFDGTIVKDSLSFFARLYDTDGSTKWAIGENHGADLQLCATSMLVYTLADNDVSVYYSSVGSYQSTYSGTLPNPGVNATLVSKYRSGEHTVQYNSAHTEATISKIDYYINEKWNVKITASQPDFISHVDIKENKKLVLTGFFTGTMTIQGLTYTSNGPNNLYSISIENDGSGHQFSQAPATFNLGVNPQDAIVKYSSNRFIVLQNYVAGDVLTYDSHNYTVTSSAAAIATVFDPTWSLTASHVLETTGSVELLDAYVLPTDTVQIGVKVAGDVTFYDESYTFAQEETYIARIGENGLVLQDVFSTGSGSDPDNTCISIEAISSQPLTYTWSNGYSGSANCKLTPGDYTITIDDGLCTFDTTLTISRNGGNGQYFDPCHELSIEWGNVITCDDFMDKDGLELTSDGGMLVTGILDGNNWFGTTKVASPNSSTNKRRGFIAKYAPDGSLIFAVDDPNFGVSFSATESLNGETVVLMKEQYPSDSTYAITYSSTGTELSRFKVSGQRYPYKILDLPVGDGRKILPPPSRVHSSSIESKHLLFPD